MFFLSAGFEAGYRGEKGDHWFYHVHSGIAGLTLMPIYLIASISLAKSLFDEEYMATSGTNYIMIATLAIIAAWYTYATLALNLTRWEMGESQILAIIPAIVCFNYLAFLDIIKKHKRLQPPNPLFLFVWISTLIASLAAKYPLAKDIYEKLPEEIPQGYGDCFIVSAAAKGHPYIVRSWIHPTIGKPVNHQWHIFKSFEALLAYYFPVFHWKLRCFYNYVGPLIARKIRNSWQADFVYFLLKPIEWIVFIILKLISNPLQRNIL